MRKSFILLLILVLLCLGVYADSTYTGPGSSPKAAYASMDLELKSSDIKSPIILYGIYSYTSDSSDKSSGVVKDGTLYLEEKIYSISNGKITYYGTGTFSIYIYFFSQGGVNVTGTLSYDSQIKTSDNTLNLNLDGEVSSSGTTVFTYSGKDVFQFEKLNYTATTATYTSSKKETYSGNIYFTLTVTVKS